MEISKRKIFRGALGGLLGHCYKMILMAGYCYFDPKPGSKYLFTFMPILLLFGMPSALFIGGIVCVITGWFVSKFKRRLGQFQRVMLGVAFTVSIGFLGYVIDWIIPSINRWSADNISTYLILPVFFMDFGIITGAVAGLFADGTHDTEHIQ